jgi:diguanylate cyclase (GGDEF)-like protein
VDEDRLVALLEHARDASRASDGWDRFAGALAAELGAERPFAIYAPCGGMLAVEAQVGLTEVVDLVPARHAFPGAATALPFGDAAAPTLLVVAGERRLGEEDAATLARSLARVDTAALSSGVDEREASTAIGLSRTMLRVAQLPDPDRMLDLVARTVAHRLGLRAITAFLGVGADAMRASVTWLQSADQPAVREPVIAEALADAAAWSPGQVAWEGATAVVLPLREGSSLLGVLVGVSHHEVPAEALAEADLLVCHAATAVATVERYRDVVAASLTDSLTGLPNHRRFHEDAAVMLDACRAGGGSFSLVVADIDDFKDLNDRRGHLVGDDVLRRVGGLTVRGIRLDDRAYRIGGEEFAVLLPGTSPANARTVCRRLQRALAELDLDGWRLTQSMGIATYPGDGDSVDALLASADAAVHEAKRLGKDRITLAHDRLLARRSSGASMARRGRRSFEQMRHLQALTVGLSAARSTGPVAEAVLGELAEVLPADGTTVVIGSLVRSAGDVAGPLVQSLADQAIRERRSLLVDDLAGDEECGVVSALAAPLVADQRIIGAIVVASRRAARFDRDDQRLLEVVGHLAGLAAANVAALDAAA